MVFFFCFGGLNQINRLSMSEYEVQFLIEGR